MYISITATIIILLLMSITVLIHRNLTLKKRSQLSGVYTFEREAQRILEDVCEKTGAINGLLLTIHNSGGEMVVGAPLYSTVIAEANNEAPISARRQWRKMPINDDHHYWELQHEVRNEKMVPVVTESLPDGSLLKGVYIEKGIAGGLVFEVYDRLRTRYFYAKFICAKNLHEMTSEANIARFRYAVNELRILCQKGVKQGYIK